jgi:putative copper export protein
VEHSVLHGTQLLGVLLALAAPILALLVLIPAREAAALTSSAGRSSDEMLGGAARCAEVASAIGGVACLLNVVVQVAEFEGVTLLAGAQPALVARFAAATTVGRLAVLRSVLLLVAALLFRALARDAARSRRRAAWLAPLALALGAALASAMVTHAAAQPVGRAGALAIHFVHLLAAASWVGVLAHLFATRRALLRADDVEQVRLVAAVVARFSPLALLAAGTLLVTGAGATWSYLGTPAALLTSAYGLTLATKLALLALLAGGGFVNFRLVRPALLRLAGDPGALAPRASAAGAPHPLLARLVRTIELEATVGVVVVATAGILASVSPPTPRGEGRLDEAQIAAMLEPRLPRTDIVDPATWVGSATRTDDDLRYSEFMHSWSGVLVCVLALAWLVQSIGGDGAPARAAAWVWPVALIPFAVFVAVASDPEVWPLGTVSPWVALTDPIVLEHRIGALMIVVLAGLGLREARRGGSERPLGRALPIVMVAGSLLLLGHAHSSFSASDALTTLINVQHAVLGGLGVLAGVVRWLELRGLVPRRIASVVWPTLVLAIGLFMTLSYRELV